MTNFHLPGERIPGDKADIWAMWVRNGRKGARQLIRRYGAKYERKRTANGRPIRN